ncbi:MAG: SDR family NAD(P)-dependent oxidoreductase [Oligoflexus sp.]
MSGNLALVTGTSRGLGYHITQGLLENGWQVFGFARSSTTITADNYVHIPIDLNDFSVVEDYFEGEFKKILEPYRASQIALINNAGQVTPVAKLRDVNLRELSDILQLNSALPIWLMGFCARTWPQLPLSVVNISSGAARKPYAGWAGYCSSKAALRAAGQVLLKDEEGLRPVRCFSFEPGVMDTSMQELVRQSDPRIFKEKDRFLKMYQQGELVNPQHAAQDVVSYLQSEFHDQEFFEKRFGDPA